MAFLYSFIYRFHSWENKNLTDLTSSRKKMPEEKKPPTKKKIKKGVLSDTYRTHTCLQRMTAKRDAILQFLQPKNSTSGKIILNRNMWIKKHGFED